jgi:aminoglycoside 3-N-acetyltransferase
MHPGGLWARLCDENAKILLLGVLLNRNTYIHAIDEMTGLEGKLAETQIPLTVIDYGGNRYETDCRPHSFTGAVNFENYRKPLERFGDIKHSKLGNADAIIFYTRPTTDIIKRLWQNAEYDLVAEEKEIPKEYYSDYSPKSI